MTLLVVFICVLVAFAFGVRVGIFLGAGYE